MAKRLINSVELIDKFPVVEADKQISLFGAVADIVTMISLRITQRAEKISMAVEDYKR